MTERAGPRLVTLDGLRGVGVMGILLMNVNAFAMPFVAYDDPVAFGPAPLVDRALWAVEMIAVDGKLRALFSALFGASMLLIADRAEAGGRGVAAVTYRRLVVLLLFGLLHAALLWAGDILVLYALVGMVAFLFRRLPVERLLVAAGLLLLFQAAVLASHYQAIAAAHAAARRPGADPSARALWMGINDAIGHPSTTALAVDVAAHRGPWLPLAAARAAGEADLQRFELLFSGPETLGLMLLGMAGFRSGFLTGVWPRARLRRWAFICYAVGVPPLVLVAALLWAWGFPPVVTTGFTDLAALPFRWLVATGHAALLVAWFAGPADAVKRRVAAVGRAAFTNYLGTSLAMTALFDGWGLGLYGRLERWQLLGPVALVWAAMLAWSAPWLRRHRHGPLEWAWRRLAGMHGRMA